MKKNETGMSLGLIAALAICCGAKLLLLSFGLSGLALLTGETALIAAAVAVTIAVIGFVVWQRRSRRCALGSCPPRVSEPSHQLQATEPERAQASVEPEPIGAGRERR